MKTDVEDEEGIKESQDDEEMKSSEPGICHILLFTYAIIKGNLDCPTLFHYQLTSAHNARFGTLLRLFLHFNILHFYYEGKSSYWGTFSALLK